MVSETIHVSICIATFRRPGFLRLLLASLERLVFSEEMTVQVIVVDNDRLASAEAVVMEYCSCSRYPVTYAVEPVQNISLARNRCIALADGDYLAFVDDDEEVTPVWLASLMDTASSFGADAVFGPVISRLPDTAPAWIRGGNFFRRPRYSTGTVVQAGGTGNLLLRASLLAAIPGPFDPRFGLTGGEDFALCEHLRTRGAVFLWCDEAVVSERVTQERLTVRYLLQRALRGGQQYAVVRFTHGSLLRRSAWFCRRLTLAVIAVAATVGTLPFGRRYWVGWAQKLFSNVGQLLTLTRYRYEQYGRRTTLSR